MIDDPSPLTQAAPRFVVTAPPFGAMADGRTDDTDSIQRADSAAAAVGGTVLFPAGTYAIRGSDRTHPRLGVKPSSGTTWLFEDSAVLRIIPQANDTYAGINLDGVSGVRLLNPTIDGNKNAMGVTTGEQGHGIFIIGGAERISIYDAKCFDCYGDGLYIGGRGDPPQDIFVSRLVADGNRRQGCSITNARHVTLLHPQLLNTQGTSPQKGLDIEPNRPEDTIFNLRIVEGYASKNTGPGFSVAAADNLTTPVSVHFIGCVSEENDGEGILFEKSHGSSGLIAVNNYQSVRDGLAGFRVDDFDVPVVASNVRVTDCNRLANDSTHLGSAFVVTSSTSGQSSGPLSIRNAHVSDAIGNTRKTVSIKRFGGIERSYISDVLIEVWSELESGRRAELLGTIGDYSGKITLRFLDAPVVSAARTIGASTMPRFAYQKITNEGATDEIRLFFTDTRSRLPGVAFEIEVVTRERVRCVFDNDFPLDPGQVSTLTSETVGSRIRFVSDGSRYVTDTVVGRWQAER